MEINLFAVKVPLQFLSKEGAGLILPIHDYICAILTKFVTLNTLNYEKLSGGFGYYS